MNTTAFSVLQKVTTQPENLILNPVENMAQSLGNADIRRQIMQEMGRRGGKKGGKARAKSLNSTQRSKIARKAAKARWHK